MTGFGIEDLGARFSRDRSFCFDVIVVHEIIFDDSSDVTLFCTVPYYGQLHTANFGLTFAQLNTLLRNSRPEGDTVATALAEKLKGKIEVPSVIVLEEIYGHPLEISNCILYTTLYDLTEDDEEKDESESPDGDEDGEYEAYAFLIDAIEVKLDMNKN